MTRSPGLWWRMFLRFCLLVLFVATTHLCVHLLSCTWDGTWEGDSEDSNSYSLFSPYRRALCRLQLRPDGLYHAGLTKAAFLDSQELSFAWPHGNLLRAERHRDGVARREEAPVEGGSVGLNFLNTVVSGFERPVGIDAGRGPRVGPVAQRSLRGKYHVKEELEALPNNLTFHALYDLNTRAFHNLPNLCSGAGPTALEIRPGRGWKLECPDFWQCGKTVHGLAAVCLNSQGPFPRSIPEHLLGGDHVARTLLIYGEYFGAVAVMSNVYTNYHAQIFDAHNMYLKGGCGEHFSNPLFTSGVTNLVRFDVAVSLTMGLYNYYHALVESVPKWAVLLPILRSMPGIPVLVSRNDDHYRYVLQVLGLESLDEFNVHYMDGQQDLAYANTLITAVSQPCGQSSPVGWEKIRQEYLHLENDNRIVFERVPDWLIVVGYRDTTRRVNETVSLVESLTQTYGVARVKLFHYKDNMKRKQMFKDIQALFSKAVVYISPHGAGLSNMVFMPYGSSVIEVRPTNFSNSCYENLAGVLNFGYHLFYSPGGKNTTLTVDVDKVLHVVNSIVNDPGPEVK